MAPLLVYVTFWLFLLAQLAEAKKCLPGEFNYEYTQCDATGRRWRVAFPKTHHEVCDNVIEPKSVNCSFSCQAGHFLEAESTECRPCPAGTYSLGDGVRYEEFAELPSGFSVENFVDDSQPFFSTFGGGPTPTSTASCAKGAGWVVSDGELRYNPTLCISKLSIRLDLKKDGYVELYFKLPRHPLMMTIVVKNEQCEAYGGRPSSIFSSQRRKSAAEEDLATNNDWRLKRFQVRKGQNLLVWTVAANNEITMLSDVIRVSRIDVVGLAFTPSCSLCPAGTYSSARSATCFSCKANSYSEKGAPSCSMCQINEYSGPKAARCHKKPLCTNLDFYPVYGPCSAAKTITSFHRVNPIVCQTNAPTSVQTPQNQAENCRNCHPGSRRNTNTGRCEFCALGEYSANGDGCQKCPNQTSPNYGLFYRNFEEMPPLMSTSCEYMTSEDIEECNASAWIPMGNRVETSPTRAKGIAFELSLNLTDGFYDPLREESGGNHGIGDPVAHLSIDFEMQCADESCQLYIVKADYDPDPAIAHRSSFQFVGAFSGTQTRKTFTHPIDDPRPTRFVFAFMRSGSATAQDNTSDRAAIYALNVTNVGNRSQKRPIGGADHCRPCPQVDDHGNCRPCPQGHYMSPTTSAKCIRCPEGTALNRTSNKIGLESCVKCPPNMGSESRSDCSFSGKLKLTSKSDNKTLNFDLRPLMNSTLRADGVKLFPREGHAYYHSFNVSLSNKPTVCRDSLDQALFDAFNMADRGQSANSNAKFCRSTAMPLEEFSPTTKSANQSSKEEKTAFISSYVISTELALITQERIYQGFHLSDDQLEYESTSAANRPIDVHFFFEPNAKKTSTCSNGTIGVVTVRCEPLAVKEPQVRLSHKCPDGTCNGCLFHVIVESSYGCPICDPKDFEEIRGECSGGYQTIHSIPSKHCVLSGAQTRERTETCSSVSSNVRLIFMFAATLISFLIVVIVVIYQKNRTLQYRYMRIVEGKEPDLNSCGLDSDEDDEEEADTNQAKVFFNKKRNPSKNGHERCEVTVGSSSKRGGSKTNREQDSLSTQETRDFLSDSSD